MTGGTAMLPGGLRLLRAATLPPSPPTPPFLVELRPGRGIPPLAEGPLEGHLGALEASPHLPGDRPYDPATEPVAQAVVNEAPYEEAESVEPVDLSNLPVID